MDKIKNLTLSMKAYSFEMFMAMVGALLKQLTILGTVGLTSYLVGCMMDGMMPVNMKQLLICLVICILGRACFAYQESYLAHDVAFKVLKNYRLALFEKISEISPAYTLRKKTGQLGQSLVGDVEVLELFLAHTFSNFVVAFVVTIMTGCFFARIAPILALNLLVCSLLVYMVPYSLRKKSGAQGQQVRESLAEYNSLMIESVQGLRELITLDHVDAYRQKMTGYADRLYNAQKSYGRRKGVESMSTALIVGLYMVLNMVCGVLLVQQGRVPLSQFMVVVMLASVALSPVSEAAAVAQELGLVFASTDRIQNILRTEALVQDKGLLEEVPQEASIEFRNVSFSYPEANGHSWENDPAADSEQVSETGSGDQVLKELSFKIEAGEMVAIVGASGAGKTTTANLLMRYWNVDDGEILINGTPVADYTIPTLRKMISAVQQEPFLFHTSIKENIRLGHPEFTQAQIEESAHLANADSFIRVLPNGYDTVVGERGYQLSGGQRQRISIARAVLRQTPIVIFDEAVSNLDTENETEIQHTLRRLMKGKTVIFIAHRLSTILSADRVIMLGNGGVCAEGTHEELVKNCEAYRELLAHQIQA